MNDEIFDLVDARGRPRYGIHNRPVGRLNYRDFYYRDPLGRKVSAHERDRAFVQFQFLGFISQPFVVGCALTSSSQYETAFLYIYSRRDHKLVRYGFRKREGDTCIIHSSPDHGESRFTGGKADIRIIARPAGMVKILSVSIADHTKIEMEFSENRASFQPLRILTPTGPNGWTYAQKVAGIKADGNMRSEFGVFDLTRIGAFAHHDYTAGFLRPDTFWNWACISDKLGDGRLLGLNISNGVNETGLTENCFWLDGSLHKIDSVLFEYDQDDLNQKWHLKSFDRRLDLEFSPEGGYRSFDQRSGRENSFDQLFGRFKGWLFDERGRKVVVENQAGFAERQYIRW